MSQDIVTLYAIREGRLTSIPATAKAKTYRTHKCVSELHFATVIPAADVPGYHRDHKYAVGRTVEEALEAYRAGVAEEITGLADQINRWSSYLDKAAQGGRS